ncbi:hypothetical protein J7K55_05045 [Candidatus Aerophobetes bacterium]|nr:hypothetical protein [Candidatus Aerophobetes bacterium]
MKKKLEWPRVFFHIFSGLAIILLYGLTGIGKELALIIFGAVTLFFLLGDILRQFYPGVNRVVKRIFGILMYPSEEKGLGASTYYVVGCWLTMLMFNKLITCISILFLVCGDIIAKIVGERWGRKRISRKTLEGSLANFVTCFLVVLPILTFLEQPHALLISLLGALAATGAEMVPKVDNLTIPLFSGIILTVLSGPSP